MSIVSTGNKHQQVFQQNLIIVSKFSIKYLLNLMATRKTEKGRLQRANKQQNQSFHPCQHDETKNFSTNILSPSLFMVHNTS
uniref:Putative ovule protein n=1 Tax=Solanum chacoense TaxID=4108 RepID=A0A0V0GSD3_SOLCH